MTSRRLAACIAVMLLTLPAPAGSVSAANVKGVAAWRMFFQRAVPAAQGDFVSMRGAFDSEQSQYAVTGPLNAELVRDCSIFQTGGLKGAWHLRCQLFDYAGQAVGPATSAGTLTRDLTAALPTFTLGANLMGEPQWMSKDHHTSVTIVFGGILMTHGDTDI